MKAILTRQHNGQYMLTRDQPIITDVRGAGFKDAYVKPGDPIGYRHMCGGFVRTVFGVELEPLHSHDVVITGKQLEAIKQTTNPPAQATDA